MKKKRAWIIWLAVFLVLGSAVAACAVTFSGLEEKFAALAVEDFSGIDFSKVPDGTHRGSYSLFPISVVVDVTMSGGRIQTIDLIKHRSGQGKPAEAILPQIIAAQSLEVDVISGATSSSNVIKAAVRNALLSAHKP